MGGILFVVATPIGNLEDITYRAVRVLREADLIACEDTRHTRKLLEHFGINAKLLSYHEHNESARARELVESLKEGKKIALVSDAGTPLLSDPGYRLVRATIEAGLRVEALPGPSALLTALVVSGLPTDSCYFGGFLPPKISQRKRRLEEISRLPATLVFYEAPHRLLETLADIGALLPDRSVVVCRELTKLHEEVLRGTAEEVAGSLNTRDSVRGEITIVLGKPEEREQSNTPADLAAAVAELLSNGTSKMDAIKAVAKLRGIPKGDVYDAVVGRRRD